MPSTLELRPTIDRRWLEQAVVRDPLAHAYPLWDLDRSPESVRVSSVVVGPSTLGYLLTWSGRGPRPVVHAYGSPDVAAALLERAPSPPFLAVVPDDWASLVARRFSTTEDQGLRMMLRPRGALPTGGGPVRRLRPDDRAALTSLLGRQEAPELSGYGALDPADEVIWGAVAQGGLVGVARAAVRLASVWVVGGVYVDPANRRLGLGRGLVTAVVNDAERAGAPAGLFVREEQRPARLLYEGLGFREVGRRRSLVVEPPARG